MTALIWRAVAVTLAVGALAILLLRRAPGAAVPSPIVSAIAVVLILAAGVDWWAVIVVRRLLHRAQRRDDPGAEPLRDQLERFVLVGAGATALAVLGVNYLVGNLLPHGVGFFFLAAGTLLPSASLGVWLIRYYR